MLAKHWDEIRDEWIVRQWDYDPTKLTFEQWAKKNGYEYVSPPPLTYEEFTDRLDKEWEYWFQNVKYDSYGIGEYDLPKPPGPNRAAISLRAAKELERETYDELLAKKNPYFFGYFFSVYK